MARKSQEISIYRIADEAGVSVATISRVMNRRAGVSEKTRGRIEQLLRKYDFKANYPQSRSARIAVIVPQGYFSSYIREALAGIYAFCENRDISINIIIHNHNKQESALEQVRDQQCVGVIILLAEEPEFYEELGKSELPVIFIDYSFRVKGAGIIGHDAYFGACEAMRHLLKLGHRKIGFLRYSYVHTDHIPRVKAYEGMLKEARVEIKPEWIVCAEEGTKYNPLQSVGIILTDKLLDRAPDITAIVCIDDVIAIGVLSGIQRRNLKIPDDISVVGFDDLPEASCTYPPLTTVFHPIFKAGFEAMASISEALENPVTWTPPVEILPTSLVVRESTGKNNRSV